MYDILREMGVTDLENIERYALRQEGDEDILKIFFKRKKGALFSRSMKFRHGRSKKMVQIDGGTHEYKEVSEISPDMLKICAELDTLVKREESRADLKDKILTDISHLEMVMKGKIQQLREDVEKME